MPLLMLLVLWGTCADDPLADSFARIYEQMQLKADQFMLSDSSWDGSGRSPPFRRNYTLDRHSEIFKAHIGGDKFRVKSGHNYSALYAETIALYHARRQPCRLVELGIFRGESLAVWTEFLGPSNVVGVDGNVGPYATSLTKLLTRGAFSNGVPAVLQGLAADAEVASQVADSSVDVLVDDAGHYQDQQLGVFEVWRGKVARAGSYVIEDVRGHRSEANLLMGLRKAAPTANICSQGNLILLRWERPLPEECQEPGRNVKNSAVLNLSRALRWQV